LVREKRRRRLKAKKKIIVLPGAAPILFYQELFDGNPLRSSYKEE